MTTQTSARPFLFSSTQTLGELAAEQPAFVRVFERLGLDYCCGGRQTLAVACAQLKIDPATVEAMLGEVVAAHEVRTAEVDVGAMGLTELANHIEASHHVYLKTELPRLTEMAERVAYKHGGRDARLCEVAILVRDLADDMISHLRKEEEVLFPLVRRMEVGGKREVNAETLAAPLRQMEREHENAGSQTARLRMLTDGYFPDAEACNTHRALLAGLAEFEGDLHRHVHKENNLLFPKALARAENPA